MPPKVAKKILKSKGLAKPKAKAKAKGLAKPKAKAKAKGLGKLAALRKLSKKNLQALGEEKSLSEKIQEAREASEDPEVQAQVLKEAMTPEESGKTWGKHNTFLKHESLEKQQEHAAKSKKEKGLSAALWLLQTEGKKYTASKQVVSALEKVKKKDAWESEKTMLSRWSERELQAHLASGRVSWREDPTTPGVWEYKDNQRVVRTSEGSRKVGSRPNSPRRTWKSSRSSTGRRPWPCPALAWSARLSRSLEREAARARESRP